MLSRSDIYSTTEKIVGQWTDGKPIYQKVVDIGALPNNTSKTVAHGISNVSTFISVIGFAKDSSTGNSISLPFPAGVITSGTPNGASATLLVDATNITVRASYTASDASGYAILQYTKSTDSATSIGVDTDYSTTEKIIGTWIDGKPLYQKTINTGALPNGTTKNIPHGISNLSRVISFDGYAYHSSGVCVPIQRATDSSTDTILLWRDGANINIMSNGNYSSYSESYVTVRYTKTS